MVKCLIPKELFANERTLNHKQSEEPTLLLPSKEFYNARKRCVDLKTSKKSFFVACEIAKKIAMQLFDVSVPADYQLSMEEREIQHLIIKQLMFAGYKCTRPDEYDVFTISI